LTPDPEKKVCEKPGPDPETLFLYFSSQACSQGGNGAIAPPPIPKVAPISFGSIYIEVQATYLPVVSHHQTWVNRNRQS